MPAEGEAATPTEPVDGDPELCCCELPADPPAYAMEPSDLCQTDSHGVCVDASMCSP